MASLVSVGATLLVVASMSAATLSAQSGTEAVAPGKVVQIVFDNDFMGYHGMKAPPDYDYTSGVSLAIAWDRAPAALLRLRGPGRSCQGTVERSNEWCMASVLRVGQEIYTPRVDSAFPVPGQRPYAGFLQATAAFRALRDGRTVEFGASLGATGSLSLAEPVQSGMHRLFDAAPQLGWSHQLPARAGALLYVADDRARSVTYGPWQTLIGASWKATVGNIRNALRGGTRVRFSKGTREVISPLSPAGGQRIGVWVQLEAAGEYVGSNLFIDAGPPEATGRIKRLDRVGEGSVSVGLLHRLGSVEYRSIIRSREYDTQLRPQTFGSIRVTVHR